MRLIDKDQLLTHMGRETLNDDLPTYLEKIFKKIFDAKTVDAIPVEFLEKQIESFTSKPYKNAIRCAINNWERENARD